MSTVFRRQRRRGGRVVKSDTFYARIGGKVRNLGASDKQVAEQKAASLVRDLQREAVGLIAPKPMRLAASRPLADHVAEYVKDRAALGRSESLLVHLTGRLGRLQKECGWSVLGDITADSFQKWRSKQGNAAPKTVNEYLNMAGAFCNWMVAQGRMAANPVARVERTETRGKQVERRALTIEEVGRLLAGAGERSVFYLVAVQTGLRRGEIEGLKWGDIDLAGVAPCIRVRASTTKNKKSAVIPLHPQLAEAFASIRPADVDAGDLVFSGGLPRMRDMRKDFNGAGIVATDTQGRKVDFHSLRKTFNMRLQSAGVGFTTAMNLMRHSDPRLTAKTYTDTALLPQAEAVNGLPWYGPKASEKGTEKGTVSIVKTGLEGSASVHSVVAVNFAKTPVNIDQSAHLSPCVATGTDGENGGGGENRTPVRDGVTTASTRVSD